MDKSQIKPTEEQKTFIDYAKKGHNVLVDACIGSGKTTAINKLCMSLPFTKSVLYLTYNRLLKLDAQSEIKKPNVTVQNYHGFAWRILKDAGVNVGVSDMIQNFIHKDYVIPKYDILMIDEYQDIDLEISEMLQKIKDNNPNMQIIAVGDMAQKIYDKTSLDVKIFIDDFLDDYKKVEFTKCFRLSEEHASMLGRVWDKRIIGVNPNCRIRTMYKDEIVHYLGLQDPKDVLCLGARRGDMSETLNSLERQYPTQYNKYTVYASISNRDRGYVTPSSNTAIFTTFDSSKGLERKICVVFDFTDSYWQTRLEKPMQKYEILRNIFCVAASRGKEEIIFVRGKNNLLTEEDLYPPEKITTKTDKNMLITGLFDFKYKEDVEDCYHVLDIKELKTNNQEIIIPDKDGLIDLTPCINKFMLCHYFDDYDILSDIRLACDQYKITPPMDWLIHQNLNKLVLYYTRVVTNQERYMNQVSPKFISEKSIESIENRIKTKLKSDSLVQELSTIQFRWKDDLLLTAYGTCDVMVGDTIYQLYYKGNITHEDMLESACYLYGNPKAKKCIAWNLKDNKMYDINIKNDVEFKNLVLKTATKHKYKRTDVE